MVIGPESLPCWALPLLLFEVCSWNGQTNSILCDTCTETHRGSFLTHRHTYTHVGYIQYMSENLIIHSVGTLRLEKTRNLWMFLMWFFEYSCLNKYYNITETACKNERISPVFDTVYGKTKLSYPFIQSLPWMLHQKQSFTVWCLHCASDIILFIWGHSLQVYHIHVSCLWRISGENEMLREGTQVHKMRFILKSSLYSSVNLPCSL